MSNHLCHCFKSSPGIQEETEARVVADDLLIIDSAAFVPTSEDIAAICPEIDFLMIV
jgi:hypothetical protein